MSFPSTLLCRDKVPLLDRLSPLTPATTSSSELALLLSSFAAAKTEGAIRPQGSDCRRFNWGRRALLGFTGFLLGEMAMREGLSLMVRHMVLERSSHPTLEKEGHSGIKENF